MKTGRWLWLVREEIGEWGVCVCVRVIEEGSGGEGKKVCLWNGWLVFGRGFCVGGGARVC